MSERVTFESGGAERVARIDRPPGRPAAWAIFAHCFAGGRDLAAAGWISEALMRRGIAVMRFDYSGEGESATEHAAACRPEDLVAAAAWLRENREAPRLLVGHGDAGAAVLAKAGALPEIEAVATIGAPATEAALAGARALGERALVLMHAPTDGVVPVDDARKLYEAARHPKSFVSLDRADHRLTGEGDARWVADLVATFAARYLSAPEGAPLPEPARGEVIVEGGEAGYSNRVRTPDHQLLSDEPRDVEGGTGTGPNPYDLLLSGLGSCTSMTLKMYADRKGWPLEKVRVRLSHRKIHAEDCADCETEKGRIDEIVREITVTGDLDAEQRARLLEIADRCPVHRTLSGEIKIRSSLTGG